MNYPNYNLQGKRPSDTYRNIVQYNITASNLVDSYGDELPSINITASVRGTASYALSASWAPDVTMTVLSASWASQSFSSSYAQSSSWAPFTQVEQISASWASASISSSYSEFSISASYAPSTPSVSASYLSGSISIVRNSTVTNLFGGLDTIIDTNNFSGSHSEGQFSIVNGFASHAEGLYGIVNGNWAHAEGSRSIAWWNWTHAEGESTQAYGQGAHSEGYFTNAAQDWSHAEGLNTKANHAGAHSEGSDTTASGQWSHTEGRETKTTGVAAGSHAEGYQTTTVGIYSHTEGQGTIASGSFQTVVGQYNTQGNTTDIFVIGGGISNFIRKDIFSANTLGITISGSITYPLDSLTVNQDSYSLDFSKQYQTLTTTGSFMLSSSFSGSSVRNSAIYITSHSVSRSINFNPSWIVLGTIPTSIAADKTAILSLTSFGSSESSVVVAYGAQQ